MTFLKKPLKTICAIYETIISGPYSFGPFVDGTNAIPTRKRMLMIGININRHRKPDWEKSCNLLIAAHKIIITNHTITSKNGIATSSRTIKDGRDTILWIR